MERFLFYTDLFTDSKREPFLMKMLFSNYYICVLLNSIKNGKILLFKIGLWLKIN